MCRKGQPDHGAFNSKGFSIENFSKIIDPEHLCEKWGVSATNYALIRAHR